MELGYRAVDADNHYYEPLDAFTRHLDHEVQGSGACRSVQRRQAHARC